METFKESTTKTFEALTDEELDLTVETAMNKSTLSEDELNAILDKLDREQTQKGVNKEFGLRDNDFKTLLAQSESYFQNVETFNVEGVFGNFWRKFNKKAKHVICANQEVINFITNDGSLTMKSTLKYMIPLIVSALGFSALTPLTLAIVIGALAYLSKVGFNAYCH